MVDTAFLNGKGGEQKGVGGHNLEYWCADGDEGLDDE